MAIADEGKGTWIARGEGNLFRTNRNRKRSQYAAQGKKKGPRWLGKCALGRMDQRKKSPKTLLVLSEGNNKKTARDDYQK